ncbi:MAG: hypothetical protein LUH36_04045, partial [Oscillospiraceae bacterium]|nr:hypothetical protein [Oscillospiraceae bacterium]
RNDVFRLFAIIDPTQRIALPEKIRHEMRQFIEIIAQEPVNLKDLGLDGFELDDVLGNLREIYEPSE